MSAAQSNTHQSFNSRGGKFSRGSNARSSSSLEEAAEFKSLRNSYSNSLKTLNEMFPDWTDADLLSAIKEADGNLEITIARIAEGHATQWGEVKSRKEKRQVTKPLEDVKPVEKSSFVPRPASFRGGVRGGAARGGRGNYSNVSVARGGRPASAAKAPIAPVAGTASTADSAAGWDAESPSESKSSASAWDTKPAANIQESKPKAQTSASVAAPAPSISKAPSKPAPMSWANIAK
ncbi:RNAPII degradation factor, partial [Kickxella alabastrina]